MTPVTSCGVIVTDGEVLLLGHATHSPRWDLPKGIAEPGEDFAAAARRELNEETGLNPPIEVLQTLGVHRYLPGKQLALFLWKPTAMPVPAELVCRSTFCLPNGKIVPELDRFGLFTWADALHMVGRNLAHVLQAIQPRVSR